ncbi:hypothetical protein RJ55_01488 [Drechmeria coniospora]|nr:hypothetical protein RJ55_01488 [Drechmeria coniospora]
MGSFAQTQWPAWAYAGLEDPFSPFQQPQPQPPPQQYSAYPPYLAESIDGYQAHPNRPLVHHQLSRTTESKPRLSKEEVEVLEAEFQKNHKPSSSTKKALAESMRVDNARINNWFQNRRAREKKENNIREYEAKQRLEKEKAEADPACRTDDARQRDLVASSAPFPEPRSAVKVEAEAALSPSVVASPLSSVQDTASDGSPLPVHFPAAHGSFSGSDASSTVDSDHDNDVSSASLDLSEPADYLLRTHTDCVGASVRPEELKSPEELYSSYRSFMEEAFSSSAPAPHQSPLADEAAPKSPPPHPQSSDIAARRNRRPPPLAIAGGRSYSSYMPRTRTATDFDRKLDRASPMRRVASATGASVRVKKTISTPRSPHFDAAFTARDSPSTVGTAATGAPPTPDTPINFHQSALVDEAVPFSIDAKYMAAEMALQDPTLRTPPTTPGFMDGLFHMGSAYGMPISEETLIAPRVGDLPAATFHPSPMADGVQAFVGDAPCQTPSSLLPVQMGSSYFNFLGNTGYDWSEASVSTGSSPVSQSRHGDGYMVVAAARFDALE